MLKQAKKVIHFHTIPTDTDIDTLKGLGYTIVAVMKNLKMVIVYPPKRSVKFPTLLSHFNNTKRQMPRINFIGNDFKVKATLNVSTKQIGAENVWNITVQSPERMGEGKAIGIVDTGIDVNHADFKNRIAEYSDFTGDGMADVSGHGTHCASCAAGDGASSMGIFRGSAPKAKIYFAKALGNSGAGNATAVIQGIDWLIEKKVSVISLSLGGKATRGGDILTHAVEHAVKDHNIIVVVAAGNSGKRIDTPGCSPYAITVGACDKSKKMAKFSGIGPTIDGICKPDIVVPGVDIIAARSNNSRLPRYNNNGMYTVMSGTSMATPQCAGAIALILADRKISPAGMKSLIKETADSLGQDVPCNKQGAGLFNVERAYAERNRYS